MSRWRPDPTFYASPTLAAEAPAERLAYVAMIAAGGNGKRDAIGVVDTDPGSSTYGRLINQTDLPTGDNELHHFGWNACSSHLCPYAPHAHVERRFLIVPGTGSSRIHILDTQPDPRSPELVKMIEAREIAAKTGYAIGARGERSKSRTSQAADLRRSGHTQAVLCRRLCRNGCLASWRFLRKCPDNDTQVVLKGAIHDDLPS